jgi:FlaA1/EpsC-like NDP-sugar epimerase
VKKQNRKRVAIYGAGLAGQQIAAALYRSDDYLPVCFIDDKTSLQGQSLSGLKIFSPKKALGAFRKFHIEEIGYAICSRARKKAIIESFERQMSKLWNCQGSPNW